MKTKAIGDDQVQSQCYLCFSAFQTHPMTNAMYFVHFLCRLQLFSCKMPIYSGIYVKLSSKDKTDDKRLGRWYQMISCWGKNWTLNLFGKRYNSIV